MEERRTNRLWRVWIAGRWQLVSAPDRDAVYRKFRKAKREQITRVDPVIPTSEGVSLAAAERAARPRGKAGARPPAGGRS